MTILERHRQQALLPKAKAMWPEQHWYGGTRNTWYGEPLHYCGNCEFESHEKAEVDAHIEAEKKEKP